MEFCIGMAATAFCIYTDEMLWNQGCRKPALHNWGVQ